jgi:hypothetical protein
MFETYVFRILDSGGGTIGYFPALPDFARIAYTVSGDASIVAVGDGRGLAEFGVRSMPNPVRGGATIGLSVPRNGRLRVRVVDLAGRTLATVIDRECLAGPVEIRWDGRDMRGRRAPAGVYFCNAELDGARSTRKFVVLGGAR